MAENKTKQTSASVDDFIASVGNPAVDPALETAAELAKLPAVAYAGNKLAMRGDALDRMRASIQ